MTTYVLVHGATQGGHTFHRVRPQLIAAGHDVFVPTLTGIGERSHLASPQVTVETHLEDVENVLLYWDLREVVLLGYSYGGIVVSGALRKIADRVAHLVFLDAFVPADGESADSITGTVRPEGIDAPWLIPAFVRPDQYYDEPEQEEFFVPRRTGQPVKTFSGTISLDRPLESFAFSRTYIKATGEPRRDDPFWHAADHARSSPAWRYHEIATNHAIPANRPDELAWILLKLA